MDKTAIKLVSDYIKDHLDILDKDVEFDIYILFGNVKFFKI